jgi:hypothetical protein
VKRLKRCLEPGCIELTRNTRCATHTNARERARTDRRLETEPHRRHYRTQRWRELRKAVFVRDGHRCTFRDDKGERCGFIDFTGGRLEAHHLDAPSEQPTPQQAEEVFFFMPRIVTACIPHHRDADLARRAVKARP